MVKRAGKEKEHFRLQGHEDEVAHLEACYHYREKEFGVETGATRIIDAMEYEKDMEENKLNSDGSIFFMINPVTAEKNR